VSSVENIINALSELENDIDGLNSKAEEMRKRLMAYSNDEIEKLKQQIITVANEEAKRIIDTARSEAEDESAMIAEETDKSLSNIRRNIDSSFYKAVDHIVKMILDEPISSISSATTSNVKSG
jgi:V/A-type H+/Na+-transporting ATPase subunit G/H